MQSKQSQHAVSIRYGHARLPWCSAPCHREPLGPDEAMARQARAQQLGQARPVASTGSCGQTSTHALRDSSGHFTGENPIILLAGILILVS